MPKTKKEKIEGLKQHKQLLREKAQKKKERKQALLAIHRPKK